MANALAALARLRRLQSDEARRSLAVALTLEAQAELAAARALSARVSEAAHIQDDPLCGAYASWLPAASQAIIDTREAAQTRKAASEQAVGGLAAARAAAKAVETVIEELTREERRRLQRRAQLRLDELGGRRK